MSARWTPDDIEAARVLHRSGVTPDVIGRVLARSHEGVAQQLRRLGLSVPDPRPPPAYERVAQGPDGRRMDALPEVTSDDGAHVRAVLDAGGYGRIPLPWREPYRTGWAA